MVKFYHRHTISSLNKELPTLPYQSTFAPAANPAFSDEETIMNEAITCFKELPFMDTDFETPLEVSDKWEDRERSDREDALALQVYVLSDEEDDTGYIAASLVFLKLVMWAIVVAILAWVVYDIYMFSCRGGSS